MSNPAAIADLDPLTAPWTRVVLNPIVHDLQLLVVTGVEQHRDRQQRKCDLMPHKAMPDVRELAFREAFALL